MTVEVKLKEPNFLCVNSNYTPPTPPTLHLTRHHPHHPVLREAREESEKRLRAAFRLLPPAKKHEILQINQIVAKCKTDIIDVISSFFHRDPT